MKRLKKTMIAVCCASILMTMVFALPSAAYANGTKSIYDNSGTKLGFAEMWTNNAETTGKVLYSQTTSYENQSYVATQSLLKGMTGWSDEYIHSDIEFNANAKLSPIAELEIPDDIAPVDARVIGGINTSIVGLCRRYNLTGGDLTCSDGSSCDFADNLIND